MVDSVTRSCISSPSGSYNENTSSLWGQALSSGRSVQLRENTWIDSIIAFGECIKLGGSRVSPSSVASTIKKMWVQEMETQREDLVPSAYIIHTMWS